MLLTLDVISMSYFTVIDKSEDYAFLEIQTNARSSKVHEIFLQSVSAPHLFPDERAAVYVDTQPAVP